MKYLKLFCFACLLYIIRVCESVVISQASITSRKSTVSSLPHFVSPTNTILSAPYLGNRIVFSDLVFDGILTFDYPNITLMASAVSTSSDAGRCQIVPISDTQFTMHPKHTAQPITCVLYLSYEQVPASDASLSITYTDSCTPPVVIDTSPSQLLKRLFRFPSTFLMTTSFTNACPIDRLSLSHRSR
jgi:hypothetical protein